MGHDPEIKDAAEALYIVDGLTYAQTAEQIGVSEATVKKWGADEGWFGRRREYRRAQMEIKRDTVALRAGLIKKAMESLDPQDVYAVARLERAASAATIRASLEGPETPPRITAEINTPADAVAAIREAIEIKVNGMLTRPDQIDLKALKNLKDAMALWEQMETKYNPADKAADAGISAETIERIRKEIMGI